MKNNTKQLTYLALLTALILMLGLTPLGFLVLPVAAVTTVHIPVIVGSYVFSTKEACYLGFIFGIASFIRCFVAPDAIAGVILGTTTGGFGFYNIVLIIMIIFVPRILVGLLTSISYKILSNYMENDSMAMGISAFIGSITNTIFFLGGLYLFAMEASATAFGLSNFSAYSFFIFLMGLVSINGIVEALIAVVISVPVGRTVKKFLDKG